MCLCSPFSFEDGSEYTELSAQYSLIIQDAHIQNALQVGNGDLLPKKTEYEKGKQ